MYYVFEHAETATFQNGLEMLGACFHVHNCPRLDSKANGTKMLVPIRPIGITAGVMDLDSVIVKMV